MDRRTFLQRPWSGFLAAVGGVAMDACHEAAASIDVPSVFLRRLTYGATPSDRRRLEALGTTAWLDEQLDPATLDTSVVDERLEAFPALAVPTHQRPNGFSTAAAALDEISQLRVATLIRAVESPAQLYERMVEFWSDHFNVTASGVLQRLKVVEDRTVMRRHALGRFKDLLVADASSPAMLVYLNNAASRRGAINENYGRELLELHTLGRNNGYGYRDIVETARLFTGWTVDTRGAFVFRSVWHDPGPVHIMGWTRPRTGSGESHGVAFLHWLAMRPQTAEHVCTRLAVRFVGDEPPPDLVDAMTRAWLASESEITPVLRAMVAHPSFANAAPKFQRPFDYVVWLLRVLGARVDVRRGLGHHRSLLRALAALGQVPFSWPEPNGYPDTEADWLNTGGLLARWNLVDDIFAGAIGVTGSTPAVVRDGLDGLSARAIHDRVSDLLLSRQPSAAARAVVREQTGWSDDSYPAAADIDARLPVVLLATLTSPEAQYR